MADQPDRTEQFAQVQALLGAPVVRHYTNGFVVSHSASDLGIMLLHNNAPVAHVSMSYITAKSLLADLQKAMESIESALKHTVPTIAEVGAELEKLQGPSNAPV